MADHARRIRQGWVCSRLRKRIYLGWFTCPAAAHFAYVIAADKAFGEFARGS